MGREAGRAGPGRLGCGGGQRVAGAVSLAGESSARVRAQKFYKWPPPPMKRAPLLPLSLRCQRRCEPPPRRRRPLRQVWRVAAGGA